MFSNPHKIVTEDESDTYTKSHYPRPVCDVVAGLRHWNQSRPACTSFCAKIAGLVYMASWSPGMAT